jgi:archaellum component FlaC
MGRLNPDDIGDIIFDCANKIQNLRAENKAINTRLEEVSRERDRWMSQTF